MSTTTTTKRPTLGQDEHHSGERNWDEQDWPDAPTPLRPTGTYRILDLSERREVLSGISLAHAQRLVERTRESQPQARYDIRSEFA